MSAKFELSKATNGQFIFNLKSANGQVILSSESYSAKQKAKAGIDSIKKNALIDERFERKASKSGEPYFVLKATNGEIIGKSEMYSSVRNMENGINSVKQNAPGAEVEDIS